MKLTHHIKNILGIYKSACIFASSLLLLATSCTDDDIPFGDDPQGPNSSIGAVKGDVLAFTVSLPTMQTSTRAINYPGSEIDETYEDYVDPDRLMVFFLDEDGYVIKILKTWDETETKAYTLVPIEDYENRDYKNYYFRLSFTELQEEGKGGDALAKFLRENPFKIAVLANVDINKAKKINIQVTQVQ